MASEKVHHYFLRLKVLSTRSPCRPEWARTTSANLLLTWRDSEKGVNSLLLVPRTHSPVTTPVCEVPTPGPVVSVVTGGSRIKDSHSWSERRSDRRTLIEFRAEHHRQPESRNGSKRHTDRDNRRLLSHSPVQFEPGTRPLYKPDLSLSGVAQDPRHT